jgi:hypothetical protein
MSQWRAIPGWVGFYEVSDEGCVRSLRAGRELKPIRKNHGYYCVSLRRGSRNEQRLIHLQVLRAFVGEPPVGHEGCHNDGDKANNRLSNLRWDTRRNNHQDKYAHGTMSRGEKHPFAKLTEAAVRRLRSGESSAKEIAEEFGMDRSAVNSVKRGEKWKHI